MTATVRPPGWAPFHEGTCIRTAVAFQSIFFSTLLLSFAATLLAAGLFAAYFGKGRSRSLGFAMALVAVLLVGLFCALTWNLVPSVTPVFDQDTVGRSMVAVLAATTGFAAAGLLFVVSVSRS